MTEKISESPTKPLSPPKFIEKIQSPVKKIPSPTKIPSPVKLVEQNRVPEIHLPVKRSYEESIQELNCSPPIIMPKVNLNPEKQPKTSRFTQPDVTSSEEDSQPDEEKDPSNQEEDEFTGLDQSSYITAGYFVPYARENRLNFNSLTQQVLEEI